MRRILRNFWLKWLDIGIEHAHSIELAKQIHLINAMRLVAAVFMAIMVGSNFMRSAFIGCVINFCAVVSYLSISIPLRMGLFNIARRIFFAAVVGTIIAMHLVYGRQVNSYLAIFPFIGAVTILFGDDQNNSRKWLMFSISLVLLTYNWGYLAMSPVILNGSSKGINAIAMSSVATILIFRWLKAENVAAESKLHRERDQLAELNSIMAANNAKLEQRTNELAVLNSELDEARKKAEEANFFKGKFLAKVSHELRTPMNGVLGVAQLMKDTDLNGEQREFLAIMMSSGQQQLAIINDLLDFAKIEAGKISIESRPVALHDLLNNIARTFAVQCDQKGVEFVRKIDPSVPAHVQSDSVKISQIVLNLLSNSVKFTAKGKISFRVYMDGSATCFEVSDTGIGMTEDQVKRLFTPFLQGDDSITRRFGGTGLGLSIAHELVALMSGSIAVKSAENKGTSFLVRLPLAVVSPSLIDATASRSEAKEIPKGLRILIAEDNETNVIVVTRLLQKIHAKLTVVSDGVYAVEAHAANKFDIIFMDLHMPRMDGLEAGRLIRQREQRESLSRTPLFALTADVQDEVVAKCRASGFDNVIEKPINRDALYEIIRNITTVDDSSVA